MNDRLTQSDIDKMQEEIDHRKLVLRPQLLVDVKDARAHGDLSENFEYKAAKKAKNQNESRIRYLEKMIKTARVIEDTTADDEVGINNQVTVWFEEDQEEEEVLAVDVELVVRQGPAGGAALVCPELDCLVHWLGPGVREEDQGEVSAGLA